MAEFFKGILNKLKYEDDSTFGDELIQAFDDAQKEQDDLEKDIYSGEYVESEQQILKTNIQQALKNTSMQKTITTVKIVEQHMTELDKDFDLDKIIAEKLAHMSDLEWNELFQKRKQAEAEIRRERRKRGRSHGRVERYRETCEQKEAEAKSVKQDKSVTPVASAESKGPKKEQIEEIPIIIEEEIDDVIIATPRKKINQQEDLETQENQPIWVKIKLMILNILAICSAKWAQMAEKHNRRKERKQQKNCEKMEAGEPIEFFVDELFERLQRRLRKMKIFVKEKLHIKREQKYEKNPELRSVRKKKTYKRLRKVIVFKNKIVSKEKEWASRMVNFINGLDDKNDIIADKTTEMVVKGNRKFNWAREYADINKAKLLMVFAAIILITICATTVMNRVTAYEYAYNGRLLGMVKNQEDVLKILDLVSEQLSEEHNASITISGAEDITFNRVISINQDIDTMQDVLTRLTYMSDMNARGAGIFVDGKRMAVVDNKETADQILENVKYLYVKTDGSTKYEIIDFVEKYEIKDVDTKLGYLQNPADVQTKILTGAVAQKTHIVQPGETLSGIAKYYNMTVNDLLVTNPTVTPEKLSIGEALILSQAVPLMTVKTVEVATYTETMPYETLYENSSSMYKGEQKVKLEGQNGSRKLVAQIEKNNGVEVGERVILEETIIDQPVNAQIVVGTKNPPPLEGTGSFIMPVNGARLTSKFGGRWGSTHNGIDLACATGTKIKASDGGTVIFSGYSGSYGNVVKISHGGNKVTIYAHCSKLLVKKGQKVYQGQQIANVGNTGRSTGPHCHFEIQVSGVPKNPYSYL